MVIIANRSLTNFSHKQVGSSGMRSLNLLVAHDFPSFVIHLGSGVVLEVKEECCRVGKRSCCENQTLAVKVEELVWHLKKSSILWQFVPLTIHISIWNFS